MKSIRTDPRNHAARGDERIRTAVCAPSTNPAYELLRDIARRARSLFIDYGEDCPIIVHDFLDDCAAALDDLARAEARDA